MAIFLGTDGNDNLDGGAGDDQIIAQGGSDTINGGAGNDTITISSDPSGSDMIDGGDGNDVVVLDAAYSDISITFDALSGQFVLTNNFDSTAATLANVEMAAFTDQVVLFVGAGGYATIQEAVDAAGDNAIIVVGEGAYVEQVQIEGHSGLTIQAAEGADVTIRAPADVVETARSGSDREIHAVVTVEDSENVVIRGITVDGDGRGNTVDEGTGAGSANYYGVFYRNSSGGLEDVDVTGVRDSYPGGLTAGDEPIVSGVQRGVGVVVDNDAPGVGESLLSFFMEGGSITDFQKNATVFSFADLTIHGVTVTGGGAQTIIAQNGFQVSNSTGSIDGNIVTGIGYAGPSLAYSASVLAFGNTDLDITDNVIVGSNDDSLASQVVGIYILDFGVPNSGGEVTGNDISHVDGGIIVTGDTGPNSVTVGENAVSILDLADPYVSGVYYDPSNTTDDTVNGSEFLDYIVTGDGADTIVALGGDDYIDGGAGADIIDAGDGVDTINYSGPASNFTFTTSTDGAGNFTGFTSVTDNTTGDVDTLTGVETLQFSDASISVAGNVQVADADGNLVGSFATIQEAVDASQDGYSISIGAGTYQENVTIGVDNLTIVGAPGAILQGTFLSDNSVTGPLNEWLKTQTAYDGAAGNGLSIAGDNVTIQGLTISGFLNAVVLGDGSSGTTLDGISLVSNFIGIHKPSTAGVTDFEMLGGTISDGHIGIDIPRAADAAGDLAVFDGVLIDGTIFTDLNRKGIYVEALSNALITNIIMTNVGEFGGIAATGSLGAGGNGINLNLKYDDYVNIVIENFTLTDVGSSDRDGIDVQGHHNGGAIVIAARDDAPSYSGDPATLTGIVIQNGTINGTSTGIELGEPGRANATPDLVVNNVIIIDAQHTDRHGDVGNQSAATMTVNGTEGNDTIVPSGNTDGPLVINGLGGDDNITGGSAGDLLNGGAGNDVLDGGAGVDVAEVGAGATFTSDGTSWTVTSADGIDTLFGIEMVTSAGARMLLVGAGGYATIQEAVDAAVDGDTIVVAAGTYNETVTVDVDVTILGSNAGVSGTEARGAEAIVEGGFLMDAEGATLDGLTIEGGGIIFGQVHGVLVNQDNVTLTNLVIRGDDAAGSVGVVTPFNGNITGLTLSNSLVADWGNGTYFNPLTAFVATGNTFDSNNVGLTGDQWLTGTFVDDNNFTGNNGHVGYGAYLQETVDVGDFFGMGNSFDGSDPLPLGIFALGSGTANGQTVTGTDESDLISAEYQGGTGHDDALIGAGGDDVLLGHVGNDTLDGGDGVDTARYSGDIGDYSITAVTDGNGNVIGFSAVTDNDGVAGGDDGADTLISVERLEFGDVTLAADTAIQLFDENGASAGVFATIQAAVDAAQDGYTVEVPAGDFDEDVNVHTGVTIVGAQGGVSGSDGGRDAAAGTGESNITGRWTISSTGDVTIDGLRFINDSTTTGGGPSGPTLLVQTGGDSAGHSITNSIFWSEVAGGVSDDRAISTQVIGSGALSITDNLISGSAQGLFSTASWGRGMWFDGGGIALTVEGNVLSWTRTALNLDMSGASTADVLGNSITNSGTGVAVGVDSDGLNLSGNTIENVSSDFNFRNLTSDVSFDVGAAVTQLNLVGAFTDPIVVLVGSGNDNIIGSEHNDLIDGNNHPTLGATADTDTFTGGGGDDYLLGRGGTDTAVFADTLALSDIAVAVDADPLTAGNQAGWQVTTGSEGVDMLSDVEIVQHAGGDVHLVGAGGYVTVQAAIDASAAGDTILIAPGLYAENVTIGHSLSLVAAGAGVVIDPVSGNGISISGDIDAGSAGAGEIRIEGLSVNGGETGVHVSSSAVLASLVIDNATFTGNRIYGVGSGSGAPDLANVSITNSTFVDNGAVPGNPNGSGSIVLFGFTGDAIIQNVDISTSSTAATPLSERADNAIQITGRDPSTYDVTDPAGNVVLDNVSITGFYHKPALFIQGYTDLSGFSFSNMTIEAGTDWGYVIFIDPVSSPGTDTPGNPGYPGHFAGGAGISVVDLSDIAVTNLSSNDVGFDVFVRGTDAQDIQTGTNARDFLNAPAEGGIDLGGDDTLSGLGGDDTLFGGVGNDTLDGGEGNDAMTGGLGNDTFFVDSASDVVGEEAGEGRDTVYTEIDYTLAEDSNIEIVRGSSTSNMILAGNSVANIIYGNAGNDVLIGRGGDDTLSGGQGTDTMIGGAGDDVFVVDNTGDVVVEQAGDGLDRVSSSVSWTLGNNLENIYLVGSGSISATGNAADNYLRGNGADNALYGLEGDDNLSGRLGNDFADGGDGNDRLTGQDGNDTLIGGDGNDRAFGGTGNDVLQGGAGDDYLDGDAGNDAMTGGAGNDIYVVSAAGDTITEAIGEGTDEVRSAVDYTLSENVENLTLIGSATVGTGNELNNVIIGRGGVNTLYGMDGNDTLRGLGSDDTLYGGAGNDRLHGDVGEDILTGGAGSDIFRFLDGDLRISGDIETITDFSQVENDRLDFRGIDADATTVGTDEAFTFVGSNAFSGTAGELRIEQIGGNTFVFGDTDGDGTADFQLQLNGLIDLTAGDFQF